MSDFENASPAGIAQRLIDDFEQTLDRLASAPGFSKYSHQIQLLPRAQKLLRNEAGIAVLDRRAPEFEAAGVFLGGDWLDPAGLEPALAGPTLRAGGANATMEALSELRLLAIVEARAANDRIDAACARNMLHEILATHLDLVFPVATEATREAGGAALARAEALLGFLFRRLGSAAIVDALLAEVARVMAQRPIVTTRVTALLNAVERAIEAGEVGGDTANRAQPWLAALHAPSPLAAKAGDDYADALIGLDAAALAEQAAIFGQAMNRHGLVAPTHADLLHHLSKNAPESLSAALGLDATGRGLFAEHGAAIAELIELGIRRDTAPAIYGLSRLIGRGPAALNGGLPGLRRLALASVHPAVTEALVKAAATTDPPPANTMLVAGALAVLGQPRGVDQGRNPTCQAARAISLWACNDPAHLLALLVEAAETDDLVLYFEGAPVRASESGAGMARTLHTELDPVSLVLTPHLDRIYVEMGRRTIGRPGDGHRWVNREMHGPWVAPDFAELIDLGRDVGHGAIAGFDGFVRLFHASYHPDYNGGRGVAYAQPCGIAATDATGTYIGWHAVSIQRVARDPAGHWRVYFFNPNRDKGQNWGQGIETATAGNGEIEGESSLLFGQFASRLYVFHYRSEAIGDPVSVPAADVAAIRELAENSWGRRFRWAD
ncbi:hypothetical protein [Salinisphaera sp.]|uniref:hypothetical protein n=1 Tax=Salinisphaera sp. TaxID=1914330 RepID=UPI002D787D41|nr:hypothetical protein [Salinisphaera sp.]HET7312960.1 hypothetical protein [Salinisphaera sp.]